MQYKAFTHRPRAVMQLVIPAVFLGLVAAGCGGHAKTMRAAQSQFNEAAKLDNQLNVAPGSTEAATAKNKAATLYRSALAKFTTLIDTKRDKMQSDQLLGTAFALKAFSEWRLENYEAAVATSDAVASDSTIVAKDRDKAMLAALRGLIKNDQAYKHMQAKSETYGAVKTLLSEAQTNIRAGAQGLPDDHDVRIYLVMSQLAVLKNWLELFNKPDDFATDKPTPFDFSTEQSEWCAAAKPAWQELVKEVDKQGTQAAKDTQAWWRARLPVPEACP